MLAKQLLDKILVGREDIAHDVNEEPPVYVT